MVNEPTEKELADLAEELGLNKTENVKDSWLQGDFGHSIDLPFLITVLILFFIGIFVIVYRKKFLRG